MKENIKKRIKKLCLKNDFEFESLDFEGEYDDKLTYKENISLLKEKYPLLEFLPNEISKTSQQKADKELIEKEVNKEYQKQINKEIKQDIKKSEKVSLTGIYKFMENLTSILINSPQKCLLISGNAGLGKTQTIRKQILKEKVNLFYISGNITHRGFINRLNEISDTPIKTICVLDDIDSILTDKQLIATLKGLLNNETTIYETNNDKFIFNPNEKLKFILIANDYPKGFEPIIDRSLFCEIKLNYYEILKVMKELVKIPYRKMNLDQQREVYNFIKKNTGQATKHFSLRTLFKSFNVFIASQKINTDYKECLNQLFETDENVLIVENLMKDNLLFTEKEKAQEFNRITNMSARTYYRIKYRMKTEVPKEKQVLTN